MPKEPYFEGYLKTPLMRMIQEELKKYKLNEEFEYPLLSRLIMEKHYYCSKNNLIPIKFRKDPPTISQYDFKAYFDEIGWKLISWKQCINPLTETDIIKRAFRDYTRQITWVYRKYHPICEICKIGLAEEVHHEHPRFKDISNTAMSMLTDQEKQELLVNYDFLNENKYQLPENHKTLQYILDVHLDEKTKLISICTKCHRKINHK